MKKIITALLLCLAASSAFAQSYEYETPSGCGLALSPVFCNARAVNLSGAGDTVMIYASWGTSKQPPAVGQSIPLSDIWFSTFGPDGYQTLSASWFPGTPTGVTCYGTVTNTGVQPAPYVIEATCTGLQFADKSIHNLQFTQNLYVYALTSGSRKGWKYWELVSGTVTVQ